MRQVRDVLMKTEGKKNEPSDPKKGIAVTGAQPTGKVRKVGTEKQRIRIYKQTYFSIYIWNIYNSNSRM